MECKKYQLETKEKIMYAALHNAYHDAMHVYTTSQSQSVVHKYHN